MAIFAQEIEIKERLLDTLVVEGSSVLRSGDADKIDALLSSELVKVATADGGWRTLYKHQVTGDYWELSFPQGEMPGGGPRQLTKLEQSTAQAWLAAASATA